LHRVASHCFLSSCANYSHSFLESLQSSNTKFRLRDSYFRIFNRKQHPEVPRTYFELCDSREIAQPARRVSAQTSSGEHQEKRSDSRSFSTWTALAFRIVVIAFRIITLGGDLRAKHCRVSFCGFVIAKGQRSKINTDFALGLFEAKELISRME
jgi:hypothetical protein